MKGFGYLVKEGFRNVYANRIMSIASICVLVSCLVLTGAAALLSMNVSNYVDEVEKNNETSVYILRDRSELEAIQIGKVIENIENVESATYVSRKDALEGFKNQLGDKLFDRIKDENVLNDSYKVVLKDLSKYSDTIKEIQAVDGVESVNDRRSFAEKLTKLSNMVNFISIGVVTALIIISLFIIANTIRATMYSRRFEISIMKSVGATNMFVRMPFLVEGMIIGIISSAISIGALALLYEALKNVLVEAAGVWLEVIPFTGVVAPMALAFVIVGILVGFFGGFISIRKYLKMEGNEILGW